MIKNLFNKLFGAKKENEEIKALKEQVELLTKALNKENNPVKVTANPFTVANGTENKNLETVAEVCVTDSNNEYARSVDYRDIDWKELNRTNPQAVLNMKADLRDSLYSVGIDNIGEVLEECRTELLQDYLVSMLYRENTYSKEYDNVDSMSRKEIIDTIEEISFENFKKAMESKGFIVKAPSEAQVKKLKELGYVKAMPKTSIGASKLIESFLGKADTKPSEAQEKRISTLIERLGFQGEDYSYETKAEASKIINELQKIADDTLGAEKASKEQIRYYGQLLKDNNQRLTQARKEFAHNCTKKEISEEINKLKEEIKKNHPEVSKGQLDYIISLHQTLMLQFNRDELAKLTKEEGTVLIAKLNKQVLYMETRRYQASLTMSAIDEMSAKEVTDMLAQIRQDRKDQKAV